MINGSTGAYCGRMIQINLELFTKEETFNYVHERTNINFTSDGFDEFYSLLGECQVILIVFAMFRFK